MTEPVILVGCVKLKRQTPSLAKDLYASPLWRARRQYAEASGRPWLILSAKHGLLDPNERVRPYDLALGALPAPERRAWGQRVVAQLHGRLGLLQGATFELHAGAAYCRAIEAPLLAHAAKLQVPFAGLGLGEQLARYRAARNPPPPTDPSERRCIATNEELSAALQTLDKSPQLVPARAWPGEHKVVDTPGLYSWWTDAIGAGDLAAGLEERIGEGRIYAGQTGATKWPSGTVGKATLRKRIIGNHMRGRIRGSTFRLTLAAALLEQLDLQITGPTLLDPLGENRLSAWMGEHLAVAVFPCRDPDPLGDLERKVLDALDPPLNLDRANSTAVRRGLKERRGLLTRGDPARRG